MRKPKLVDMIDILDEDGQVVELKESQRHRHSRRGSSRRSHRSQRNGDKHERKHSRNRRHSDSSISDHAGEVSSRHHKHHRRHSSRKNLISDEMSSTSRRSHKHNKRSSHRSSKSRRSSKGHSHRELHKEFSKTPSQSTASSSSEDYSASVWDDQWNRLQVVRGIVLVEEEGQEVEYYKMERRNRGWWASISTRYKLVIVVPLVLIVIASAVMVLLGINSRNQAKKKASQNANIFSPPTTTEAPTLTLTKAPTRTPYPLATRNPTPRPTPNVPPTSAPTAVASDAPTRMVVTYIPGKLTVQSNGLLLSEGLQSRIVATSGKPVPLTGNAQLNESLTNFHREPDGAAVFPWFETGGWVYVSNSEVKDEGRGGVGAIYFNKDGNVVDYQRLLDDTTMNCGGGPTPWGTWVTCEEINGGKAIQVDPFGVRPAQPISNFESGYFEAFAYDIRKPREPAFYVTEDKERGPLRRILPSNPNWNDPWNILHGDGALEYLVLEPNATDDNNSGSFYWTTERETAKTNSQQYYKHSEGIDVHNDQLFFVSKVQKELFILNLDSFTYEVHTTVSHVFDGQPDQMKRLIHDSGLLYFCEEGGKENGVHARDENGWFFTILESATLNDETTGLAFSPDFMHMYVSYQHNGLIFDIWREDNLPFHARTLNVKYHEIQSS